MLSSLDSYPRLPLLVPGTHPSHLAQLDPQIVLARANPDSPLCSPLPQVLGMAGGVIATLIIGLATLYTSHVLWRFCMLYVHLHCPQLCSVRPAPLETDQNDLSVAF